MTDRPRNGFLRSLDANAYEILHPALKPIALVHGREMFAPDDRLEWVHFPETALLSMIASDRLGRRVESAMIGNEGAGGLMETCGSGTATLHCVVQVDGQAWRAPSSLCRELALSGEGFARRAWTAAELQMFEARQSAFCQARHTVEARFARWLLESLERSGGRNPMPLTQEFVAAMLGVQRTTVSGFASQLQREGLITYHRGSLTLVDEAALERRACECRAAMIKERTRLGFLAFGS